MPPAAVVGAYASRGRHERMAPTKHGEHASGGGHECRTASRRRHKRVVGPNKTTTATMNVRSIIDLVGMSRLRAQHGEHVSCGGHGSRTHEWWRRPVKIITRSVKTFTQACEDL